MLVHLNRVGNPRMIWSAVLDSTVAEDVYSVVWEASRFARARQPIKVVGICRLGSRRLVYGELLLVVLLLVFDRVLTSKTLPLTRGFTEALGHVLANSWPCVCWYWVVVTTLSQRVHLLRCHILCKLANAVSLANSGPSVEILMTVVRRVLKLKLRRGI